MFRRDVVSCGSACAALRNSANASASSPLARSSSPVARWATALFGFESSACLLSSAAASFSPLARCASASSASAVASDGLRTSTSRASADRLVDLPALAQRQRRRGCARRPRSDDPATKSARPSAASFCSPRRRRVSASAVGNLLRVGRELRGRRELLLGAGEIACVREHDAQVVARLPQVRVDPDRLAQERRRALTLPVLRGLHPLHHLAHSDGVRRRQGDGRLRTRPGAAAARRTRREKNRKTGRRSGDGPILPVSVFLSL